MSILIRRTWEVEGVLTDPTSVKLSDATGTFGVIRNDTSDVVVADNTAMTKISTGVYEYTLTEPAAGLTYTAWIEVVHNGTTDYFEVDLVGSAADTSLATTVGFTELQNRIARFAFGQRSITGLSTDEVNDINACIKDGLHSIYLANRWSFMRPLKPITTIIGTYTYDLPVGFDTIEGALTFAADEGGYCPLRKVEEEDIRKLRQDNEYSDRPTMYAIVPATFSATVGTAWQMVLYPTPDAVDVLTAKMRLRATMIDADNPYPLGAEVLSPVIIEACLAAAERTFRDGEDVHGAMFRNVLLPQAIAIDKDSSSPDTLGIDHGEEVAEQPRLRTGGTIYWDAGGFTGYI